LLIVASPVRAQVFQGAWTGQAADAFSDLPQPQHRFGAIEPNGGGKRSPSLLFERRPSLTRTPPQGLENRVVKIPDQNLAHAGKIATACYQCNHRCLVLGLRLA